MGVEFLLEELPLGAVATGIEEGVEELPELAPFDPPAAPAAPRIEASRLFFCVFCCWAVAAALFVLRAARSLWY